ncbi:uncharacterized protein LOC124151170 [Haliotis rufescens]|uniref:uncharacterized protein LOC124151170 n=1 Tax=Haliotis rufescens TaxID=6454 RepID=UPI00201EE15C|nr:uncharacterized protein LOC124151170 [Haliotis rufescens]
MTSPCPTRDSAMLPVPATEESDDFHPMEGPLLPPDQDPQTPPTTVQHGHFQTLQLSLDDEALSRHDQSLHHCRWRGVILENQTVIPPGVENFNLPYHGSERLGRRNAVTRRTLDNHTIISKQYSRADFKRAEVELAITSGCGTMTEIIGVIWNHCTVQILQKCFNGVTLTELLKTRQRLTDLEVNLLNYRLLLFLKNIHNKRILHRNIDPDHIMISRQDLQIYVVGCSALCKIDDSIPDFFGTLYSSPEVARGEHHDYKTDVFSLGCTMLSAVSGRIPYFGTDRQQIYLPGILHQIAIGEFPVDDILRDMVIPTSLRDMISDMTQYPQEERLSVDELLQKYYSHGEPPLENWYYHPQGTAPPVDQYRRTPEPTVPRPPVSDGPSTVNLPSAEILEGSSDNGEEGGEDEGEDEGVVLPPKPPSDHLSDSGRQTISDVLSGPPTGLNYIAETEENNLGIPYNPGPTYPEDIVETEENNLGIPCNPGPTYPEDIAETEENNLGILCNPGPTYPEEFYTIEVKENERLVCEVTCRPDSRGRDLHSCVKEKMKVAFMLKYENKVIRFDHKLQHLFLQRSVTVTMERVVPGKSLVPLDAEQRSTGNSDEADFVPQIGSPESSTFTDSDLQDDMSSLTTMAGDIPVLTRREVYETEQHHEGGGGEPLMAEQRQEGREPLVAEQRQEGGGGEPLVAEQRQEGGGGEPLVAEQRQEGREPLVSEQRQEGGGGEPLVSEQRQEGGGGEPLVAEQLQEGGGGEPLVTEQRQEGGGGEPLVAEQRQEGGGGEPLVAEQRQEGGGGEPLVAEQRQEGREPLVAEQRQEGGGGEPLVSEQRQEGGGGEPLVAEQRQEGGGGEPLVTEQRQEGGGGEPLVAEQRQEGGGGEPLVAEQRQEGGGGEPLVAEQRQEGREPLVSEQRQEGGGGEPLVSEQRQEGGGGEPLVAEQLQEGGGGEPLVTEQRQEGGGGEPLVAEQRQEGGGGEPLVAEQHQEGGGGEPLVAEQRQEGGGGEPLVTEQRQEGGGGEPLVAEQRQEGGGGEPLVAEQRQEGGGGEPLVAEQRQEGGGGEPLVTEQRQEGGGGEPLVAEQRQEGGGGEPLVAEQQLEGHPCKTDEQNDGDDSGCVSNLEITDLSISDTSQFSEDASSPMSDKAF